MKTKTLAPSVVTARDPKGLKFMSIVDAAYTKAGLSEEEAQRVNDTPGLADHIGAFIAENRTSNKFKDEETSSSYGYLSGYKPEGEDLDRQIIVLQGLFPGLGGANPEYLGQVKSGAIALPQLAEKFFAIPNWMKNPKVWGSTYSAAVQKMLDKIAEVREGKFVNHRKGLIDEQHLRQSVRTKKFFQELSEAQGNPDILIISAQFGIRHRGRSVRRALEVMASTPGECGLGAFAVGMMILTHAERLKDYNDLWIDCAGDEFDTPGSDVRFDRAPCFYFHGGRVGFGADGVGYTSDRCGSASGFLPQKQ